MKKKDKLAMSHSGYPQFESVDINELESWKNKVIEDRYKSDNTPFENKAYECMIAEIEEYQMQFVTSHYYLNGKFPDGIKEIVSYVPKSSESPKVDFKIDEWSELEIKIALYDVTFVKKGTGRTSEHRLSELGWKNNLKADVLRVLSNGVLRYGDFNHTDRNTNGEVVIQPISVSKQSVKQRILEINKTLKGLFTNMNDNPVTYERSKKVYDTPIKITLLDADEKVLETKIKQKRKFGHKGEVAMTFAPDFRDPADTYNDNRSQMQDKLSEFLPIDEQEDDTMY